MKRRSILIIIFFIGMISGVFAMTALWTYTLRLYPKFFLMNFEIENESLMEGAVEKGDNLAEAFHAWNLVSVASSNRIFSFQMMESSTFFNTLITPFYVLLEEGFFVGNDSEIERGREAAKSLKHARLAIALEHLGLDTEAEIHWKIGYQLTAKQWSWDAYESFNRLRAGDKESQKGEKGVTH